MDLPCLSHLGCQLWEIGAPEVPTTVGKPNGNNGLKKMRIFTVACSQKTGKAPFGPFTARSQDSQVRSIGRRA